MSAFAISSDGARIAFTSEGDGQPILLIHGFASNGRSWWSNGWAPALIGAGFRVIAIDLRGHGESDKPRATSAYGDRTFDDIIAVLKSADAPVADVLTYSMGSIVAIGLLMRHGDRVRRAVIGGVGATYFTGNHILGQSIVECLEADSPATIGNPIDRLHRFLATRNGNDRFALAALMRASHRLYRPVDLQAVSCPVLVVSGADDDITGPPSPLADAFADGHALTLPGCDHGTVLDHPDFKKEAIAFLQQRLAAKATVTNASRSHSSV